jgi:hypothetical protein
MFGFMDLLNFATKGFYILAISIGSVQVTTGQSGTNAVNYEDFGAVGDGAKDDMPAIQKAHEHANKNNLPVRTKPGATYHLGRKALTAVIETDTDWGTSKFIIDDSEGVENKSRSLFEIRSTLKPITLKIDRLKRGQTSLDIKPPNDCLVYVENDKKLMFIRKGGNQNNGTPQKEVFILKKDGTIIGAINWDYDEITKITAQPLDEILLHIRGGIFTNIANQMSSEDATGYWARNISIKRSRTVVDGVVHRVTGEMQQGLPYGGFLSADRCAYILYSNCVVDGRKTYSKMGKTGSSVPMGTYGYHANLVVDFRMNNCRMGNDVNDRSRWGVVASNFMKNMLVENSILSRVDVHMGVSGSYVIKDCTLGHAGLNAIGSGQLIVENTTLQCKNLVSFRSDYGSTWEGDVIIRNCRWLPPNKNPTLFGMQNDGTHDFGYPCFMPKTIRIEDLTVQEPKDSKTIFLLEDPFGKSDGKRPFPFHLTEKIEIKGFKSINGNPPQVSSNPEVTKAVKLVIE